MTGQLQTRLGGLTATRVFRDGASAAVDLSNVIPFARARRAGVEFYAPSVTINPADRPAPLVPGTGSWLRALLLLISLIAHSGLFYLFWQEPQPLPGTGSQGMTVEIIVGDNRPLGSASIGLRQKVGDAVQDAPGEEVPEDQKVSEAREVKPEEMQAEVTKEQLVEQPREPDPRQVIAMVETPLAEIPTVLP